MRILLLVPIVDIRTLKICEYFSNNGYEIDILSDKEESTVWKERLSKIENADVEYLYKNTLMPTQVVFDPIRLLRYKRKIKKNDYDLVYTRDIFVSYSFLKSIDNKNFKTVVDIADDFVSVLKDTKNILKRIYNKIVNPLKIENYVLKNADITFFVCDAARVHFYERHNINTKNYIIPNSPYLNDSTFPKVKKEKNGKILYVGTIDKGIRDFDTIIKADEYLERNLTIDCYSFDYKNNNYVKEIIGSAEKCKNIKINFFDAVDNLKYNELLSNYSAGLIPHNRNDITDYTIPNKIYDYWSNDLYILSSNNPSIVNEFEFINQLVIYEGENEKAFANSVNDLYIKIEENQKSTPFLYENSFEYYLSSALNQIYKSENGDF